MTNTDEMSGRSRPVVTIALPTYNRRPLLERALRSALDQTLSDIEVVVLDNASTDDTAELMAKIDDPRVQYIRRPENIGHRANATDALRRGTAPYVKLLFDDDYLYPDDLASKVEVFERHPDLVLVHSAFERVTEDGRVVLARENWCGLSADTVETSEQFITRTFESPCRVHIATALIKRDVAVQVGFRDEDAPADDHAMWLQIATHGNVGYLERVLASFTVAPGWSSQNGYMAIEDGAYRWTLARARAFRIVLERFLDQQGYAAARRAELQAAMDEAFRHQLTLVVREQGLDADHPIKSTLVALASTLRADWRVVTQPRFPRAVAGRARELYRLRRRPVTIRLTDDGTTVPVDQAATAPPRTHSSARS